MTLDDQFVRKLHDSVVETIRLAISRLYRLPIEELKVAKPSLDEIIRLCALFNKIVAGTDVDGLFTEAMGVMSEAAEAAKKGNEKGLTDCAYHLEDFLARLGK